MEAEIFKLICSNHGAISTEDLLLNLYPGEANATNVSKVIKNQEKFVVSVTGLVVVRSGLRLCPLKNCPATCGLLHLCRNHLFTGSCHYSQSRRGCTFPHTLDSDHNARTLIQHGVEDLSRAELCMLLLQNDNYLLPPICYDYNNGVGEFGKCETGNACKRLHICEKYLRHGCSCLKNHDFKAPQPLKVLQDKGVPDVLFPSLKSAYANKEVLKSADISCAGRDPRGASQPNPSEEFRGRGRFVQGRNRARGRGGNRGNHGFRSHFSPPVPVGDIFSAHGAGTAQHTEFTNSNSRWQAAHDQKSASAFRGRGANRRNRRGKANRQQLSRASSVSDIFADATLFDLLGDNQPNQETQTHQLPNGESDQRRPQKQRPVKDKTEICMYFIKGHCIHEDRCFKAHDKMPYRWEVKDGIQWSALPDNEGIEKDYCDPQNSYSSSSPPVHFDTMKCGSNEVRRLSTINSVTEPTYLHTTEWLWYWQDEVGKWNLYASDINELSPSNISSADLEQKFLDNDKDVEFSAGSQQYSLNFQDMMQTNKKYGTSRVVSRRPRFVSAEGVKKARKLRPNHSSVPEHWDKSKIPEAGFSRIPLQRSSEEFQKVEALFSKTMIGFQVQIERIQNKALWEKYQLQKNQMKISNGGRYVTEKQLFHGTDSEHVDKICRKNLDGRICGIHGTAYGKGTYFSRDANYSHGHTSGTAVKHMFLAQVLVGTYCKGSSDYKIPPSKDGRDYDSCVNDVASPSIFVVFKEQQIFPEYLIIYKDEYEYSAVPAASAPRPAVTPTPTITPVPRPATPTPTIIPVPRPSTPTPTIIPVPRPSTPTPKIIPIPRPATPTLTITPVRRRIKPTPTISLVPRRVKSTPTITPVPRRIKPTPTISPVPRRVKSTPTISPVPRRVKSTPTISPVPRRVKSTPTISPVPRRVKSTPTITPVPRLVKSTPTISPVPRRVKPTPTISPVPRRVKSTPTIIPVPRLIKSTPTISPVPRCIKPTPTISPVPRRIKPTPTITSVPRRIKPTPTITSVPRRIKPTPTISPVPRRIKPTPTITSVPRRIKPTPTIIPGYPPAPSPAVRTIPLSYHFNNASPFHVSSQQPSTASGHYQSSKTVTSLSKKSSKTNSCHIM